MKTKKQTTNKPEPHILLSTLADLENRITQVEDRLNLLRDVHTESRQEARIPKPKFNIGDAALVDGTPIIIVGIWYYNNRFQYFSHSIGRWALDSEVGYV